MMKTINPKTKRKIDVDGRTFKKLIKDGYNWDGEEFYQLPDILDNIEVKPKFKGKVKQFSNKIFHLDLSSNQHRRSVVEALKQHEKSILKVSESKLKKWRSIKMNLHATVTFGSYEDKGEIELDTL